jgi:hypothetical protein
MAEQQVSKGVDPAHEIKLDSTLVSASWLAARGIAGQTVEFEVRTCFVGNGAAIKVTGKSEGGKKLGKVSDKINNNLFIGEFEIPEDIDEGDEIYFEFDLSKNGISGESERIPVIPGLVIKSIKWSAKEARRGDVLDLTAEVDRVPDKSEVTLIIYEHDQDGAHDRIAELPATVDNGKIKVSWEYEYFEDTDEVPTDAEMKRYGGKYNPPEYFFVIQYEGVEYGEDAESGLLTFKDYLEIELTNPKGDPVANEDYKVTLPDGSTRQGKLDEAGRAIEKNVPPGKCIIEFPNL